uniref:Uncharacterized protein n=1 Tax=viral metagenome TaxID=1070528 RepID=A0A6C0AW64_9ZZZZ
MSFESEKETRKENKEDKSNHAPYSKEFEKIITDFIDDIENSFGEYKNIITTYYIHNEEESVLNTQFLFDHVMREFPEKFFDILYQREELFEKSENNKKELLPNIDFVELWNLEGITDTMKDKIWKYLQLVLFSVVSHVKSNESFGDTAKLFEAINETDFRDKLEDTIKNMSSMFENMGINIDEEDEDEEGEEDNEGKKNTTNKKQEKKGMFDKSNLPDADELHKHISSMMDGKLGKLATEIAEETAAEMDIDVNNIDSEEDVFKKLFKNPTKLMGLVKKVGGKLDSKIKSGDIKESELMDEASELMKKMKDMPGMDNLQSLFKGMNIPGMGKKARFNTAAFERMQKEQENKEKMMERAKKRAEEKKSMNQQLDELKKQFENMTPEEIEKRDKALMELIQEEEDEEEKNKISKSKNNKKKKKKKGKK